MCVLYLGRARRVPAGVLRTILWFLILILRAVAHHRGALTILARTVFAVKVSFFVSVLVHCAL